MTNSLFEELVSVRDGVAEAVVSKAASDEVLLTDLSCFVDIKLTE